MKKILILLALSLTGCWGGYASVDNYQGIIVTDINTSSEEGCYYYGLGYHKNIFSSERRFSIKDTCGKFTVGDTIKLVK